MESELYKVTKKDLPKLQALLNKCFASDPLYETLIPNEDVRKRLLPHDPVKSRYRRSQSG